MPKKQFYWNWVFVPKIQAPDALYETAPGAASLSGVSLKDASQKLGQRRYHVRSIESEGNTYFLAERNRFTALAMLVTHLSLVLLLLGIALSALFGWREPLNLGPNLPAKIQHLNGATLSYKSYSFSLLPSGRNDVYGVKVTISSPGQADIQSGIAVNKPLFYKNAAIFLLGPGQGGDVRALSLVALSDPGIYPIFTAGFLMLIGLVVSFSFPYRAIRARMTLAGEVRLAGWPANADRELAAAVEDLQQTTPENAGEGDSHVD